MEKNDGQIPGYFLSFTPEEKRAIDEMLLDEGYEPGIGGIKKLLLDFCEPGESVEMDGPVDRVLDRVENYVRSNPDTIKKAVDLGTELFISLRKKRR